MIRNYKNNVSVDYFKSLSEFINAINSRKENEYFSGRSKSSQRTHDYDFFMTETYAEATEIMKGGYAEGVKELKNANVPVSNMGTRTRTKHTVDVIGYAPHIANAIAGHPLNMMNARKQDIKVKTLTINYDLCTSAWTSTSDMVKAGRNVMDLVVDLERQGYRIQLNVLFANNTKHHAVCSIRVKEFGQPLNPLKLSYLLIHPSFFRRHIFRWIETSELTNYPNEFSGYGRSWDNITQARETLSKAGMFEKNSYYTNIDEAIYKSGRQLAEAMGLKVK